MRVWQPLLDLGLEVGDARDDARDAARNDMVARNMAPGTPMDRAPAPAGGIAMAVGRRQPRRRGDPATPL